MTALPVPPSAPQPLMTVAQFAALPEDNSRRYELVEGNVVMSPRPLGVHQRWLYLLLRQVDDQLPGDLVGPPGVDVDLGLVPPAEPGVRPHPRSRRRAARGDGPAAARERPGLSYSARPPVSGASVFAVSAPTGMAVVPLASERGCPPDATSVPSWLHRVCQ